MTPGSHVQAPGFRVRESHFPGNSESDSCRESSIIFSLIITIHTRSGHYAPGVISNGMVYVSGQLSLDPDTREVCKDDIRAHARQALENVDRVLKAAGSDRTKVVQCRVYTTKGEYWGPVNEEYAAYFGDHRPARIVVTVPELHFGCLVEIEAVAEL